MSKQKLVFSPIAAWQPQPLGASDVKELVAGLLSASIPAAAKRGNGFYQKLMNALYNGGKIRFLSVDLEALPMRHNEHQKNADSILLVAGIQPIIIDGLKVVYGLPKQKMVSLPEFNSVDLANWVHSESKGYDALVIFYAGYDHGVLQSYEPLIRAMYGSFTPLPPVCIDIMKPFAGQGISASQAHLSQFYSIGVEKPSVSMEIWDRVVTGAFFGLGQEDINRECRRIRDERNRRCLIDNIADLVFIAKNIRYQKPFKIVLTYPNDAKMAELLGKASG